MSGVIRAVYEIRGDDPEARATAVAVEQSHELPTEYAPAQSLRSLGRVVATEQSADGALRATVEYPAELAGGELPQLLVHLMGNVSLQDGVRLVELELPERLGGAGPRLGARGIRSITGVEARPVLATALKPVGLDSAALADLAYELAAGGIDLIKDDQGLANQSWAPYRERVERVADAVAAANADTGSHAVYLPVVNSPFERFEDDLAFAASLQVGGVMLLPGVGGLDRLAFAGSILRHDQAILAHPSMLGGFTASGTHGIAPELLLGSLLRLAGADAVIFPSFGGRFSLTEEQCRGIADGLREPVAGLEPAMPAPGGGMSVARVQELIDFYGPETILLIGTDLHRDGDLRAASAAFRAAVEG
jgi:ribulose-bisphosphate carboxylase large chain